MIPEKSFDTGEIRLNYAEGPASGPPLLLLHGLTGWWQDWQSWIPELTPDWHVYACDLRGHGKSERAAGRYRITDYAQDIVAFLRHHTTEPTVIIAHSLGALVALKVAAQAPQHVAALVLLDPPLLIRNTSIEAMPGPKGWFTWVYETVTTAQSYADVVTRCRAMAPDAGEASIKPFADQISGVAPDTVLFALQDRSLEGFDLEGALQHITCPTLLLRGDWELGGLIRDEDADFVQANLPRAVIIKIPGAGHELDQQHMGSVLEHMRSFLQPA